MITSINAMFEAIDGCDWTALSRFFGAACIYERPGYAPIRGLGSLERFYRDERRIASGRHVLRDHFEKPGSMIVTGDFSGLLRDGAEVTAEFADYYRFADGLIAHRRTFFFTPLI